MDQEIDSFISFKLGEEYFAISVSQVLNILQLVQITKVPTAPDYMKGVINLRGTVLPIIDIRMKFGMDPIQYQRDTVILVLNVIIENEKVDAGILVDSVKEVFEIKKMRLCRLRVSALNTNLNLSKASTKCLTKNLLCS